MEKWRLISHLPLNPLLFHPPLFIFPPSTNLTINRHRLQALRHFPGLLWVISATICFPLKLHVSLFFFSLSWSSLMLITPQPNPHDVYKITPALYALSTLFWFHTWSSHRKYQIVFVGDLAGHVWREHKSPVPWSTEWVSSYAVIPNPHWFWVHF